MDQDTLKYIRVTRNNCVNILQFPSTTSWPLNTRKCYHSELRALNPQVSDEKNIHKLSNYERWQRRKIGDILILYDLQHLNVTRTFVWKSSNWKWWRVTIRIIIYTKLSISPIFLLFPLMKIEINRQPYPKPNQCQTAPQRCKIYLRQFSQKNGASNADTTCNYNFLSQAINPASINIYVVLEYNSYCHFCTRFIWSLKTISVKQNTYLFAKSFECKSRNLVINGIWAFSLW